MARNALSLCLVTTLAMAVVGSSDDRFIKKYAMMKIYESCFGPEVVKQIRQEMKDACAKCSAPPVDINLNQPQPPPLFGKLPPGFAMDPNTQTITKLGESGAADGQENELPIGQGGDANLINAGKLTQAILAFRPQGTPFEQQPQLSGIPPSPYMPFSSPNPAAYRPYSGSPFYPFPYSNPSMFYPANAGFNPYAHSQYQAAPNPYQLQAAYYQQMQQPPYYASHRMSRNIDLRERIEELTARTGAGKMKNITCIMQELGYLDDSLEPNYEKITSRIANLPVSAELKGDMQDGLQFCQKFAQCVPEIKKDQSPLSRELIRPMFFFRCYKHKKLEACIMKDIRERFTSDDDLETDADSDTDFRSISSAAASISRSGKALKEGGRGDGRGASLDDPQVEALDEMAVYMYDFLSGSSSFDFDLYM